MKQISTYLSEVRLELTKVTWPKKEEVTRLTLTVFIISAIVGIYVGLLDFGLVKLVEFLISS